MVAFEMLTGQSPFNGRTTNLLFQQVIHDDVVVPSKFAAATQDILNKLLTKDPENRLGSKVG